jgi:hypothetical protein
MTPRRLFLSLGFVGLIASAARPAASSPVDIEGTTYGGSASGGWACGPDTRVKYGGVGAEVRIHPTARPEPGTNQAGDDGIVLSVGGAAEHRAYAFLDCNQCSNAGTTVPPAGVVYGGTIKAGYDGRWIGVNGGLLLWQNLDTATDTSPTTNFFPELSLRVGPLDRFRAEIGIGSYGAPTILRPGLWAGVVGVLDPGWELAFHESVEVATGAGASGGYRSDLTLKLPVTRELQVGLGGALTAGGLPGSVDQEGRVLLVAHIR